MLQQQTVRDLRAAIKPQLERPPPGPDLYLPPQFTEDGYLVDATKIEIQRAQELPVEGPTSVDGNKSSIVEEEGETIEGAEQENDEMVGAARWQKAARKKKIEEQRKATQNSQKPMTHPDTTGTLEKEPETIEKPEEKPVSRAERRRKIKEEILAAGEGEGFKGYRRRMW